MPQGGLLSIFSHPDDETFGIGGSMALCARRGIPVTMVCATRGEVGEITPGTGATSDTLGQFREQELRDACALLGVTDVRFLGFRDSGMKGTPENEDPRAFVNAHPDAVIHQLVRLIRELQPDVVATWDESGGYGHPDHVAMHFHATTAFEAAGDASKFPTSGAPYIPKRLFYNAIPIAEFGRMMEEMRERGVDIPTIAEDDEIMTLPRLEPNCVVDVSEVVEIKEKAMLTHATQISDMGPFMGLPDDIRRRFFSREYFHQARPPLPAGKMLDDLFAGL